MRIKDKQKIILAVGLSALIAGAVAVVAFSKFRARRDLLAKIDGLERREKQAKDKIKRIPQLRDRRKDLARLIEDYAKILPKEHHVQHDAFMEIIDGFRKDTNIFIRSAEPVVKKKRRGKKKKAAKDNFIQHKYKFELVAKFKEFLKFLNRIENHDRFLRIDEFVVEPLRLDSKSSPVGKDTKGILSEIIAAEQQLKQIKVVVSTFTYSVGNSRGRGRK